MEKIFSKNIKLSKLPKIDQIISRQNIQNILTDVPKSVVVKITRNLIDKIRNSLLIGKELNIDRNLLETKIIQLSYKEIQPRLQKVINATGVIIHTNLGRSPLAKMVLKRLLMINKSYSNLEYNLDIGGRSNRFTHLTNIICELTGAEDAIIVNNNAAAVFISLQSLSFNKDVIVSRGQLVEIGGSFRIPDIIANSGAILREVGTTNKTHIYDYVEAITENTSILLKVHTSNFSVVGFHEEVSLKEMHVLAKKNDLLLMEDLGSGTLIDFSQFGLPKEPTIQECLSNGADLITFSGDKLLGGPQAGIILGKKKIINQITRLYYLNL